MSVLDLVLTAVLSSSAASGLVVWILKTYLKNEIAYHFQIQIEAVKQQFQIELGTC
jgi:hypothetical protein